MSVLFVLISEKLAKESCSNCRLHVVNLVKRTSSRTTGKSVYTCSKRSNSMVGAKSLLSQRGMGWGAIIVQLGIMAHTFAQSLLEGIHVQKVNKKSLREKFKP